MKWLITLVASFIVGAVCLTVVFNFFMSLRDISITFAIILSVMFCAVAVIAFRIIIDVVKLALHQHKIRQFLKLDHIIIGSKGIIHVDESKDNQTSCQATRDSEQTQEYYTRDNQAVKKAS